MKCELQEYVNTFAASLCMTALFYNGYQLYWLLMNGKAARRDRSLLETRLATGVWPATELKEHLEREIEERNQISKLRKEDKKYLLEEASSRGPESYVRDYDENVPVLHLGIFFWVCCLLPHYAGFYYWPEY